MNSDGALDSPVDLAGLILVQRKRDAEERGNAEETHYVFARHPRRRRCRSYFYLPPPQLLFVYTEEGSSKGGSDANSICSPLAGCANRSSAA